jgi:hypothetical protein
MMKRIRKRKRSMRRKRGLKGTGRVRLFARNNPRGSKLPSTLGDSRNR